MHGQVDECCDPAIKVLWTAMFSSQAFNAECIVLLEDTEPAIVDRLTSAVAQTFDVQGDGTVISKFSGQTIFVGSPPSSVVRTMGNFLQTFGSSSGTMLATVFSASIFTNPHGAVLFDAVRNIISEDPSTRLAKMYRRHVEVALLPQMRTIANIFESHASLLELPTKEVGSLARQLYIICEFVHDSVIVAHAL
eukprot:SAG31_NODE_4008_length_3669_cov_4.750420_5_plen_193_part_00